MSGVLVDTGKGLLVCELHMAKAHWCFLGDMLDAETVGLFNPTLPPILKFISSYYEVAPVSEVAANLWEEDYERCGEVGG